MSNVVDFKSGVRAWGKERETVRVRYDFAKDAGAQGALGLFSVAGQHIVADAKIIGVTSPVGAGATVSVGKSGDAAGLVAATAIASLAAGKVAYPVAADDTSNTLADGDVVYMTIGTADLTAGVLDFLFELQKA
jgi:hypothetical protein